MTGHITNSETYGYTRTSDQMSPHTIALCRHSEGTSNPITSITTNASPLPLPSPPLSSSLRSPIQWHCLSVHLHLHMRGQDWTKLNALRERGRDRERVGQFLCLQRMPLTNFLPKGTNIRCQGERGKI